MKMLKFVRTHLCSRCHCAARWSWLPMQLTASFHTTRMLCNIDGLLQGSYLESLLPSFVFHLSNRVYASVLNWRNVSETSNANANANANPRFIEFRRNSLSNDKFHIYEVWHVFIWGTRWRSWLRHCATSRKIADSIPDGIIGNFYWFNPSGHILALGADSDSNRNEHHGSPWG